PEAAQPFAASALLIAAAVCGPTIPSAVRPFDCWNAATADSVAGPYFPSTVSEGAAPMSTSACWSACTSGPLSPGFSFPAAGRVTCPGVEAVVVVGVGCLCWGG